MTATKSVAQTVLLFAGFFAVSIVWSDDCPDQDVRAKNTTTPDVAHAAPLSASDLYKMFHDVRLNELDDLGDYVHNFHKD